MLNQAKTPREHKNPWGVNRVRPVGGRSFMSNTKDSTNMRSDTMKGCFSGKVCFLCKKPHDLEGCKSFLNKSLSERKSYARDSNLCFGCLCFGHISRMCMQRKICKVCRKMHQTAFH